MKLRVILPILASLVALSGCSKPATESVTETPASVQSYPSVQLVMWSDFHSAIYESKNDDGTALGGLPVFMAAVEHAKGDGLSLVLDSGDMFQGAMPFNEAKGMGMIEMMNYLKIDAATFGNHEFDYGPGVKYPDSPRGALREAVEASTFPWVNANIVTTEDNKDPWPPANLRPYVIIPKGPYKIAVIGLDTFETPIATIAAHVEGLKFRSPAETLKEIIPEVVAQNPDFVIVQAHLTGLPKPLPEPGGTVEVKDHPFDEEIGEILALPEDIKKHINLILAAHSHESFIAYDGDLAIFENYNIGKEITLATLEGDDKGLHLSRDSVKKWKLVHKALDVGCGEEPPVLEPMDVGGITIRPSDKGRELVTKYEKAMSQDRCEVVSCFDEPIEKNVDGEDPLGNLVSDAMRKHFPDVEIAFQNARGLRIDIPRGKLYRETLNNLMPFDNYLLLVEMPGSDVAQALKVASTLKHGATKVSGLTYQIEPGCSNPEDINGDGKIDPWENNCLCDNILVDGKPLDYGKTYRTTISDFMFNGGDSHGGVFTNSKIIETGPVIKSVLLKYVQDAKACYTKSGLSPADSPRIVHGSCQGKFAKAR